MEKMKKIKNMCELEKYVGEMADIILSQIQ